MKDTSVGFVPMYKKKSTLKLGLGLKDIVPGPVISPPIAANRRASARRKSIWNTLSGAIKSTDEVEEP